MDGISLEPFLRPIEDVTSRSHDNLNPDSLRGYLEKNGWTVQTWQDPAGTHHPPHQHPYSHRVYVESGTIEFRVQNDRFRLQPGDTLDLPARVEHSATVPKTSPVSYWLLQSS